MNKVPLRKWTWACTRSNQEQEHTAMANYNND